ncbi:MAG: hypothetical protein BWY58_00331 [Chloroflexi bacterium ADurb.Bin344]|nr:MAG: hypothetical protein BWY58_00331 [Chloroflexi bacterium ADurb.Bin344]
MIQKEYKFEMRAVSICPFLRIPLEIQPLEAKLSLQRRQSVIIYPLLKSMIL